MAHIISKYRGIWYQAWVDPATHRISTRNQALFICIWKVLSSWYSSVASGSYSGEKAIGNLSHTCTSETVTVLTGSSYACKPGLDQVPILRAGKRDQPHLYYIRARKLPNKNLLSEEGATEARQLNIPGSTTYIMAATAAKLLQLCPTLCDPTDGSPPGSPIPRILQARTLEWVAISFSNA